MTMKNGIHMRLDKFQSGSFVIEALISILLFAIGIVALMMVAVQGTNQTVQAKARNDASYLAGELIGQIWVSVNPNGAIPVTLNDLKTNGTWAAWQSRVAATMPIGSPVPDPTISGTQVFIDIAWPDTKESGVNHHYKTSVDIVKN